MTTQDEQEPEHIPFGGREGRVVPGESVVLTPEQVAARKRRNVAIALSLVAFCVLVFIVALVRIGQNFSQGGGL